MKKHYKFSIWYFIIGIWVVLLVQNYLASSFAVKTIPYSQFISYLEQGKIAQVAISANQIQGRLKSETTGGKHQYFKTIRVDPETSQLLDKYHVEYSGTVESTLLRDILSWILPVFIFLGVWFFLMKKMMPQQPGFMAFGKNKAKIYKQEDISITFNDVAGVDEAKVELEEIIEFLKTPEKYTAFGGQMPKGLLLVGPPGTGKTMLAKAVAGESNVPFFGISGSEFVEMFVGLGAARVRDLFEEAKKNSPCIIFIDELDALGKARGIGGVGGHDEREQTLNQLLVEMDGFEVNDHVIVIAATNRQDILDPALLRPGRFDRQVMVPLPDVRGREKILQVHAQQIKVSEDVDWSVIAKGTPGFSGAQLASMINEAALLTARSESGDHRVTTMETIEKAKDKVMMGAERRSMIITEAEKKVTAYHESGHALVAWMLPGTDPVHKVTIIPRGKALGLTMQLPEEEKYSQSRTYLFNNLCTLLGGRLAESIVFDEITTGASNDIERASDIARKMVCEWGMSDKLGPLTFKTADPLNGQPGQIMSETTVVLIDQEVKKLIQSAYDTANNILVKHRKILEEMTQTLLEKETITGQEIAQMVKQNTP